MKTLYEEALELGAVTGNHESDLYLENTARIRALLTERGAFFTYFTSRVSGEIEIEVPFAYDPFWRNK